LNWHPGQYQPPGPSWLQFVRYLNGLKGAISLDFVGVGLFLCFVALIVRRTMRNLWSEHSTAVVAGFLLLLGGIAIYLPMDGISGRYTMPAVWGLDVLIAVILTSILTMPSVTWKRVAVGKFAIGLIVVAIANIGRQEKFAARAEMLWQALEWVEREPLSPGTTVAWISDSAASTGGKAAYTSPIPGLNIEEGIHFDWHLRARHRANRSVQLLDEAGHVQERVEVNTANIPSPQIVVTAFDEPPLALGTAWEKKQTFEGVYWAGWKRYRCSVWIRTPPTIAAATP